MLGHLGIHVVDLRAAKAYYDALLPLLGFTEFVSADDEFAYRPAGRKAWHLPVLLSVHRGFRHLAAADRVAALGVHAMFWLDPWGFMLEAVCHYGRD